MPGFGGLFTDDADFVVIRLLAESTGTKGEARGLEGTATRGFSCNFLIVTVPNVGSNPTLSATFFDLFYQALELPAFRAMSLGCVLIDAVNPSLGD